MHSIAECDRLPDTLVFLEKYIFNSRTAIAEAIIGLLLVFFLFRRHDFCYDHMTSQPFFVHSFMQFQLNCMCDVIFRS